MIHPVASHPCLSCGACCAFYRVSFHWTETTSDSHGVPLEMTNQISQYVNSMKGTNQANPNCVALKGVIGQSTSCEIYDQRPQACRSFKASFEDGDRNEACEEARISKGLLALTISDWS